MPKATVRDVAKLAKVAPSTVSLYMRGMDGVAGDTGKRIQAAMKKLGYKPKIRRPKHERGGLVSLVIEQSALSSFSDVFYGEVIEGIEAHARSAEIGVLLTIAQREAPMPQLDADRLLGAIILGESHAGRNVAEQMIKRDLPVVLVDHYYWDLPVHAILPDNRAGGYAAVQHLVERGHERIGIVQGSPKYHVLADRVDGARRALSDSGLSLPKKHLPPYLSAGDPRKGYREMQRLLALPEPPTAVFAVSDKTAVGAMAAIADAGLRVPEDISVVGFDDVAKVEPALTTVGVRKQEIGRIAMQRFIQILKNGIGTPTRTSVSTKLIVRASSANI